MLSQLTWCKCVAIPAVDQVRKIIGNAVVAQHQLPFTISQRAVHSLKPNCFYMFTPKPGTSILLPVQSS